MKKQLTIFTPTFNRYENLKSLYDSLKSQETRDFVWYIVDDGSTDDTAKLVQSFISENLLEIKYQYQQNRGKQSCWNVAVTNCETKYFCGIDSDDTLFSDNILKIIFDNYICLLDQDTNTVGLRCCAFSSVKDDLSANTFSPLKFYKDSWVSEIKSNKIGDRCDIWKVSVLKKILYPVTENIKFIPEMWLYAKLSQKGYNFIYVDEILIRICDAHDNNRLSRSSLKINSLGQYIARKEVLKCLPFKMWILNFKFMIKNLIRYSQFSNYNKVKLINRISDVGWYYAICSYLLFCFVWVMK